MASLDQYICTYIYACACDYVTLIHIAIFCLFVCLFAVSRQYEEQNVHAHQERMKRKNEIQNQLARLQNQLEYERSRDTMKGIRTLASTIKKDEDDLKRLQQEEEDTSKVRTCVGMEMGRVLA